MLERIAVAALILQQGGSCASAPPAAPAQRQPTQVSASFGKTWDAVIDYFAENTVSIRSMDRASGFVAAEPVTSEISPELADCGSTLGTPFTANAATYNVLVRGDRTTAKVKATIRFVRVTSGTYGSTIDCSSTGRWESRLEDRVKAQAEGRPIPPPATALLSGPRVVRDSTGREWRVTYFRPSDPMAPEALEFASAGEVRRHVPYTTDWRTWPDDRLLEVLKGAKDVIPAR
jgi:hypothetical protein